MASSQSDDGSDLYDCQVCLHFMMDKNPRTLACLHSFCEKCLQKLLNNKTIQCPTCRAVTNIAENDVKLLPVNFVLNKMKDMKDEMKGMKDKVEDMNDEMNSMKEIIDEMESIVKTNQKSEGIKDCSKCDVCESFKATYKCKECVKIMCALCKSNHDNVTLFKSHFLHKIASYSFCEKHGEPVTHSCLKCAKHLCMKCMLLDHVEHSEFYEFHDKAVGKFDTEMKEMKTKLEGSLEILANKKYFKYENAGKIALLRKMLSQELKYHEKRCNEIETLIKEIDSKSDEHEQIFVDFTKTKDCCEVTLEKLKKVVNDTESDICGQYAVFKLKVDEALDMIETVVNKEVEIPCYDEDWIHDKHEQIGISETKMLRKDFGKLVTLYSKDSIRCKGQIATFGNHVLSVTDLKPHHVVRLNEKGKLIARYYPEKENDKVIGVSVYKNKIYIVQEKGITVIPTRTNSKDKNMFYQLQLHKDSKICVIDDSNILFTSPEEGSVYLYNTKDNTRKVILNNLKYPTYLSTSVTGEGHVYLVTERDANLIKVYDNEWKLLNEIGDKDKEIKCTQATVITEMGTVLVCDGHNNRISHFRLDGTFLNHIVNEYYYRLGAYQGLAYKYPYLWTSRSDGCWLECYKLKKADIQ